MLTEEQLRQGETLRRTLRLRFVLASCFGALFFAGALLLHRFGIICALLLIAGTGFLVMVHSRLLKTCSAYYRPLLEQSLSARFEHFLAGDAGEFLQYNMESSGLVAMGGDDYRCYEPFSGRWHGMPFSWGAIHYEDGYPTIKGRMTFTRFCGTWLIFRRPVTFVHPIIVLAKRKKLRWSEGQGGKMHRIHLPEGEFDKNFLVYSTNDKAATYMLDAALQKRLLTLAKKADGRLLAAFEGHTLHVAVSGSPKSFEVPLFGDIRGYVDRYQDERVDWPRAVVDTLWPTARRA